MCPFTANWLVERINRDYVQQAAMRYARGRVLDAGCGRRPYAAAGARAPVIDSRYPLADIAAAHTRMGENANAGKLVLDVQSP